MVLRVLKDNIKTHKRTGQRLLLKENSGLISTLFLLDTDGNKILSKNKNGRQLYNTCGEKRYEIVICLNENLKDGY